MVPEMRWFTIEPLDLLFNTRIPTRKFADYSFATTEGEAASMKMQSCVAECENRPKSNAKHQHKHSKLFAS